MSEQSVSYRDAATSTVVAAGAVFTYRAFGPATGTPLLVLTHLGANLDGWDPRVLDPLAQTRRVIALGYRGVGDSTGRVRTSIPEMAADVIAVLDALDLDRVDVFGLSMGGMVAQALVARAPERVHRLILAGSGPQGGPELDRMTGVMVRSILRGIATFTDPKALLFFTRSTAGRRAAGLYLERLKERTTGRESPVSPGVYRAQLTAVKRWARSAPAVLPAGGPVLIVHGDSDRMVPPANAAALARLIPEATVSMFTDSGHGVVFQNHAAFTDAARAFLRR